MSKRFFEYHRSGDTAEHAARGVGPATDYATPMRTVIDAPFEGMLTTFWNKDGGNSLRLTGGTYTFVAQHLDELPTPGHKKWRSPIALSGNTGNSTGPHVHCYIIINATGQRISFHEWLRDYVNAPKPASSSKPRLVLPAYFWYKTAADAERHRNPRGGRYGGGIMLDGPYDILQTSKGGAYKVRSRANGVVWVSPVARQYRK